MIVLAAITCYSVSPDIILQGRITAITAWTGWVIWCIQLKMFSHGLKSVNTLMPVQNLYESISRRTEAVLKAKGDATPY